MTIDYITRPEFEEHKSHLDTRFDGIERKIDDKSEILEGKIDNSIHELKDTINKEKLTTTRFWIGIAVPSIISILSIVVTIFK